MEKWEQKIKVVSNYEKTVPFIFIFFVILFFYYLFIYLILFYF